MKGGRKTGGFSVRLRGTLKRENKSVPVHSFPEKTACSSYGQTVGGWRLVVVGGGWWLVIGGGWWRLVVVGGWRLVAAGGWRWQLVAVGGWWESAVSGWWSLGAVLKGGP